MRKIETENDIDGLHGEVESRNLEIKSSNPETHELIKTEKLIKTVQGILNGVENGGHIILGLSQNEDGEVDKNRKTPVTFPCSIKDMSFRPKNYDEYRNHVYKMIKDNTYGYREGMCTIRPIPAKGGGDFIVIEVKQSVWRPHRHNNGRCYIRRDGFTDEMTPEEQELESLEKHRRLAEEGYLPKPSAVQTGLGSEGIRGTAMLLEPGKPFVKLVPFGNRNQARDITLIEGAQEFLKLIPTRDAKERSGLELKDLMRSSDCHLGPFGRWNSSWTEVNKHGAVTFQQSAVDETKALNLTQVFKSGEIWGIDAFLLNAPRLMEFASTDFAYIPSDAFEEDFESGLANYLQFAETKLELALPLRFVAGLIGVEGYALAVPPERYFRRFEGNVVENEIVYEGLIDNYETPVREVLMPFFKKVWEACGVTRPDWFRAPSK